MEGYYIKFNINNELYGVRSDFVERIIEVPEIRLVPKAPDFIEGIVNVDGHIVPVINPFLRFDIQELVNDEKRKLLLFTLDNVMYGIITGDLLSQEYIDAKSIEDINPILRLKESPFIKAMAKTKESVVYLLDLEYFLFAGLDTTRNENIAHAKKLMSEHGKEQGITIQDNEKQLVFIISDDEFSLPLSAVDSILKSADVKLQKDKGKQQQYFRWQDKIVPLVNIEKITGEKKEAGNANKIIVINTRGFQYGIFVKEAKEILTISKDQVNDSKQVLHKQIDHIKAIANLENGKRILVMLNEDKLFNDKIVREFEKKQNKDSASDVKTADKQTEMLLLFNVNNAQFAIPVSKVAEVIKAKQLKKIPKAPEYILGMFSLRGYLVTAIDMRKRLQLKSDVKPEYFILIEDKESLVGIAVDKVYDISMFDKNEIKKVPEIIEGIETKYISGVIGGKNSSGSILLINLNELIPKS